MSEVRQHRQAQLFDVHGHKLTCYAIAKLCRANKSTFENKVKSQGYTIQQAVNTCGLVPYERLKELLS